MSWKYVNPGYAELTVDGGTTVEDKTANPLNGVKYTSSGDNRVVYLPAPCPQDLWLKVLSNRYNTNYGKIIIKHNYENGIEFNSKDINIITNGSISKASAVTNKNIQMVVIHWHFSKTDGFIEIQIDDQILISQKGNVGDGIDTDTDTGYSLRLRSDGDNYWANIILADYDISDEQIATAKLTDPTGTWDGITEGAAKATAVGQILSQKIDAADLKEQIAAQSPIENITGVTVAGLKMQYDTSKVNQMTGVINDGSKDVFTETQTMNSNFSTIYNAYQKDMTIEDITKLTCSLKAAKA